jgi:hypothetical protein
VAHELGVTLEFVQAFSYVYEMDSTYAFYNTHPVMKLMQRNSIRGQEARDGAELAKIFKMAYKSNGIIYWTFKKIEDETLYNSHQWEEPKEYIKAKELGINKKCSLFKCKKCEYYGGYYHKLWDYKKETGTYAISDSIDPIPFSSRKHMEIEDKSCDELIIEHILT